MEQSGHLSDGATERRSDSPERGLDEHRELNALGLVEEALHGLVI
jgi:hypothetical protein